MSRRKRERPLSQAEAPETLRSRLRPPCLIALGSPAEAAHLVAHAAPELRPTCWQLDLFQAERLRALLAERNLQADVVTAADLWDVAAPEGAPGFQTAVFL